MTQAIGYIRRSTDRQNESLEQQRAKLESYAAGQGWTLVEVFADDAISGSDLQRPGLQALMRRAREDRQIEAVLTWDRNRLARPKDAVDGLLLERELMSSGKRLLYVGSGTEAGRSFTSCLVSYIENHQNGDYLRKLSRDTMRGLVARAGRGLWPGGPIPFGYDRLILGADGRPRRIVRDLEDASQAVIDPATGRIVEQLPAGQTHHKQEHETCTLSPSDEGPGAGGAAAVR